MSGLCAVIFIYFVNFTNNTNDIIFYGIGFLYFVIESRIADLKDSFKE
jgi:hypothetical protein